MKQEYFRTYGTSLSCVGSVTSHTRPPAECEYNTHSAGIITGCVVGHFSCACARSAGLRKLSVDPPCDKAESEPLSECHFASRIGASGARLLPSVPACCAAPLRTLTYTCMHILTYSHSLSRIEPAVGVRRSVTPVLCSPPRIFEDRLGHMGMAAADATAASKRGRLDRHMAAAASR